MIDINAAVIFDRHGKHGPCCMPEEGGHNRSARLCVTCQGAATLACPYLQQIACKTQVVMHEQIPDSSMLFAASMNTTKKQLPGTSYKALLTGYPCNKNQSPTAE